MRSSSVPEQFQRRRLIRPEEDSSILAGSACSGTSNSGADPVSFNTATTTTTCVSLAAAGKALSPMAQWSQLYFRKHPPHSSLLAAVETTAEVSEHSMLCSTTTEEDPVVTEAEYSQNGDASALDDDDDSDSDDDLDSGYDTEDSAEETRLAQQLVRAAFGNCSKTNSSTSHSNLARLVGKRVTPTEHLKRLVPDAQFYSSFRLDDFFFEPHYPQDGDDTTYTLPVAQAIRQDDATTLERLWLCPNNNNNSTPISSNISSTTTAESAIIIRAASVCGGTTGDSIVHLACRRGATRVVSFLLQHGVSVRHRDEYFGRTPLHEAWYVMIFVDTLFVFFAYTFVSLCC